MLQKTKKHSSKSKIYTNKKIIVKLNIKKKNNKGKASSIVTSKSCHSQKKKNFDLVIL